MGPINLSIVANNWRMNDWLKHLENHVLSAGAELDLDSLKSGDLLQVVTHHTTYTFKILQSRDAELSTDRPDRPRGLVRINGCTFGQSSTIKPRHLFCGGNLEFQFKGGECIQTTTEIKEIRLARRMGS